MPVPDEDTIIGLLNEEWATIAKIRSRIAGPVSSIHLANALRRMEGAGKIERKVEQTTAPKRANKQMQLTFYRRRVEQREEPSYRDNQDSGAAGSLPPQTLHGGG